MKQHKNTVQTTQNTVNTNTHITKTPTQLSKYLHTSHYLRDCFSPKPMSSFLWLKIRCVKNLSFSYTNIVYSNIFLHQNYNQQERELYHSPYSVFCTNQISSVNTVYNEFNRPNKQCTDWATLKHINHFYNTSNITRIFLFPEKASQHMGNS